jgi:hypothetical protein
MHSRFVLQFFGSQNLLQRRASVIAPRNEEEDEAWSCRFLHPLFLKHMKRRSNPCFARKQLTKGNCGRVQPAEPQDRCHLRSWLLEQKVKEHCANPRKTKDLFLNGIGLFFAATRGTSTRCSWSWTGPRTRPSWGPTQSWASPWQTHGRAPPREGSLSTSTSQTWQVRGAFVEDHSPKLTLKEVNGVVFRWDMGSLQ